MTDQKQLLRLLAKWVAESDEYRSEARRLELNESQPPRNIYRNA